MSNGGVVYEENVSQNLNKSPTIYFRGLNRYGDAMSRDKALDVPNAESRPAEQKSHLEGGWENEPAVFFNRLPAGFP